MELAFLSVLKNSKVTASALVAAISLAVDSGVLVAGDRLPSTREISLFLGIHRTTVTRAFDLLVAQGYLVAEKGSRTVVAERVAASKETSSVRRQEESDFSWSDRFSEIAQRLTVKDLHTVTSGDATELNNGAVPPDLLPTSVWQKILSYYCQIGIDSTMTCRSETFGYPPLRLAIAQFLRRTQGIVCHPDQIVLYSGAQAALANLAELLVLPDQLVVCENPGYPLARELFDIRGARVLTVPVDDQGIMIESLRAIEGRPDWLYVTPSCQDPTGAVLLQPRRETLIEWCKENRTAIIEDSWDSEFRYCLPSLPTLFSMDRSGAVIYLYNFWHVLFPLCSTAVLVLPERLVSLFSNSKYLSDRQFPTIEHYVLTKLLEKRHLEKHLHKLWKTFRERRQSLLFELKQTMKHGVSVVAEGAGMHVVVRFDSQWQNERILDAGRAASLPLVSTEPYYAQEPEHNEFMINFAALPCQKTKAIVEHFAAELGVTI
jgi:GntR family transcriptional regulator/MocR family aminotransferase